jgi:alpha-amylase
MTATKTINGEKWYYQEFDVNTKDYSFNIIFNQGSGETQTVDIGPLSEDTYYEISDIVSGKFTVKNVTDVVTAIAPITYHPTITHQAYDMLGRKVEPTTLRKGTIYIQNGKKYLKN